MPNAKTDLDGDDPLDRPFTAEELSTFRRVPFAKHLRWRLRLTQEEFSARFAIPLGTLRDWEQGRTEPDATANAYLKVIAAEPDAVARVLRKQAA
jgi:putative transcriptional regulator